VTFTDVLGDKLVNFYAQSYAQYRTTALTYVNLESRLQYALQGFSSEQFYFGQNSYLFQIAPFVSRDLAEAVRSQRGVTAVGTYPFNRYTRLEVSGGYVHLSERYTDQSVQDLVEQEQVDRYGSAIFRNGHSIPVGVALVQETTIFREYGPVAGNTFRLGFEASPSFNDNWLSRRTLDGDARHYARIGTNGVLALRLRAQRSWGESPDFMFFGGNSEMRGYNYLQFLGHKAFFANAELRFPLIEAMLTPVGVLGGLRGVFFFNVGGAGFNDQDFQFMSSDSVTYEPTLDFTFDALGNPVPIIGEPVDINGFRLVDGRASYGIGLESFLLGFPMHFDWSWKTLFNRDWEDAVFAAQGGSGEFRKMKFSFWIGYDF
jgi:outer membrane protein assembly factor BamA